MTTAVGMIASNRELRRKRWIPGYNQWVESSDTFYARIQPKWTDAVNRTTQVTFEELFLNTSIFRDFDDINEPFIAANSFTFPSSGQSYDAARSGTFLAAGDRVVEVSSGKTWMIRSIAEYRDSHLSHDEIIASEASQLDMKWVEPAIIYNLKSNPTVGFDPLMNQFNDFDENNYDKIDAFGAIAFYDTERFSRDASIFINRKEEGKRIQEPIIIYMDADFNVNENSLLFFRKRMWRIMFLREAYFRVYGIGCELYKERNANQGSLIKTPTQQRYLPQ